MRTVLLLCSFLLAFSEIQASDSFSQVPQFSAHHDEVLSVAGCVNVASGHFFQSGLDLEVDGPEPLRLVRTYENNRALYGTLGFGVGIDLPLRIREVASYSKHFIVGLDSCEGSNSFFLMNRKSCKSEGGVLPTLYQSGWTSDGGAGHPKNTRVQFHPGYKETRKPAFEVVDGLGAVWIYTWHHQVKCYLLGSVTRATGNKSIYFYDRVGRLSRIEAYDSTGSILMGKISVGYENHRIVARGSNGSEVIYRVGDAKHYYSSGRYSGSSHFRQLRGVSGTGVPDLTFGYEKSKFDDERFSWETYRASSISNGDNPSFRAVYDWKGRVTTLFAPLYKDRSCPWYTFEYHKDKTVVKDAYGYQTHYYFNQNRQLLRMERHRGKGGLRRVFDALVFKWDAAGQLLQKHIEDSRGKVIQAEVFQYDQAGNITKKKTFGNLTGCDPEARESTWSRYSYSDDGRNLLLSEQEEGGPLTCYEYENSRTLRTAKKTYVEGVLLEATFFQHDSSGSIIEIVEESYGEVETYCSQHITRSSELASFGQALEIVTRCRSGEQLGRECLEYEANQLVRRAVYDKEDRLCYATTMTYDANKRLVGRTDEEGRLFRFQYDMRGNLIEEELVGSGYHTQYTYDAMNRKTEKREVYDTGEIVNIAWRYDLCGWVIEKIDDHGISTFYKVDELGRVCEKRHPPREIEKGAFTRTRTTRQFDQFDRVIEERDECDGVTKTTYTLRGQKSSVLYPNGTKESYRYNKSGSLERKIDVNGSWTWYGYDDLGQIVATERFAANDEFLSSSSYRYSGRYLVEHTDVKGCVTRYRYDTLGRKVEEQTGDRRKSYHYDALGRQCEVRSWLDDKHYLATVEKKDFLGRVVERSGEDERGVVYWNEKKVYNLSGNCVRETNGDSVVEREYNSGGELTSFTDAEGHQTRIHYNHNHSGRFGERLLLTTATDPLGRQTLKAYNYLGQVISKERRLPTGQRIDYAEFFFTAKGAVTSRRHFIYSEGSKVSEYQVIWERDAMGAPLLMTEQPNTPLAKTTSYEYSRTGALVRMHKPDGVTMHHEYDVEGRLRKLSASDDSVEDYFVYDQQGNLIQTQDLTGRQSRCTYNDYGELVQDQHVNGLQVQYEYNALGQLTRLILPDNSCINYEYTGWNLFAVKRNRLVHSFEERNLDGAPIREMLSGEAGLLEHKYDASGRTIRTLHANYTEDLRGAYDQVGNLLSAEVSDPKGAIACRFSYDPLRQLASEGGVSSHSYTYDSMGNRRLFDGQPIEVDGLRRVSRDARSSYRYDASGNMTPVDGKKYCYDASNRLVEMGGVKFGYDAMGRRMSKGDDLYFYLGNVEIGCAEADGTIKELRVLSPDSPTAMGNSLLMELDGVPYVPIQDHRGNVVQLLHASSGNSAEVMRYSAFGEVVQSGTQLSPWRFAGKRFDSETGLVFFGARYYLPHLGRWLTEDPLRYADGPNLYAYVHNSPLVAGDPTGLYSVSFRLNRGSGGGLFTFSRGPLRHRPVRNSRTLHHISKPIRPIISGIYKGSNPSNRTFGFVTNGIDCNLEYVQGMAKRLSSKLKGADVGWVYNPDWRFLGNMVETIRMNGNYTPKASRRLAEMVAQAMNSGSYDKVYATAHSQGAAILSRALSLIAPSHLGRMHVRTYGGAFMIHNKMLTSRVNYIARGDLVPGLLNADARAAKKGQWQQDIEVVGDSREPFREAHEYYGKTYSDSQDDDVGMFLDRR